MNAAAQTQAAVVHGIAVAATLVALLPAVAWVEESVEARVSGRRRRRRPGPLGLLAPAADIAAHLTKAGSSATSPTGDRWLALWEAAVAFLPLALLFGVVATASGAAIAPDLAGGELALGLPALLALIAFLSHGVAVAGPGAGSRLAAAGSMRALTTQSGALVAWSLCLVALATAHGSVRLSDIGLAQADLSAWNLWTQPLGFAVFIAAAVAMSLRPPFAASRAGELSGGTGSSTAGPRQILIAGGRHAFTLAAALAATHLYLGAGHIPGVAAPSPPAALAGVGGKCLAMVVILSLVSASLPRLTSRRAAQVAWRLMVPAAVLNLSVTGLLTAFAVQP